MKLSQDDKDLLALLAFRGEATIGDLARELRRREHTVRYNLKKLLDNELCFFYAYINPHSLGYVQYELFISIKSGGELGRKALMKALADNHRVTYVGTLAGEYQVDAIFHSQSLGDFRETIDSIPQACPNVDYEVDLVMEGAVVHLAPNYLEPRTRRNQTLTLEPAAQVFKADELDKAVLEGLYNGRYRSMSALARDLSVADATLGYRIKKLKEAGVLMAIGYMPDFLKIGLNLTTLLVKAKRPCRGMFKRLTEKAQAMSNVSYLIENYGAWDYQIGVTLFDAAKLPSLIDKLNDDFHGEISRIAAIPAFEVHKWRLKL